MNGRYPVNENMNINRRLYLMLGSARADTVTVDAAISISYVLTVYGHFSDPYLNYNSVKT
jgi:hypothetical protein